MDIVTRIGGWFGKLLPKTPNGSSGSFARLAEKEAHSANHKQSGQPGPKTTKVANLSKAIIAYRRGRDTEREAELRSDVLAFAVSFDDWIEVANGVPVSSSLWRQAVNELALAAISFDQHETVYQMSEDTAVKSLMLEKLATLANTTDKKLQLYELVGPDSIKGQAIFQEITSHQKSNDEWRDIFEAVCSNSPLKNFAATKLIEEAETLEALADLACEDQISDTELELLVLEKMRGVTASFEDWQTIVVRYNGTVETLALGKMIEATTSVEELTEAADCISEDDGTETKLKDRAMNSFVWSNESCREILDDYDDDHVLFDIALQKLLSMTHTSAGLLQIYLEWDFSDENAALILEKLSSIITQSERVIIAVFAEEGSDLEEWAQAGAEN